MTALSEGEIFREYGDQYALLPLRENHRHILAAAPVIELDRAREAFANIAAYVVARIVRVQLSGQTSGLNGYSPY